MKKLKEIDYPNKPYGCELDSANPAFYIKDHTDHGKALKADYTLEKGESTEDYWKRVGREIECL